MASKNGISGNNKFLKSETRKKKDNKTNKTTNNE